MKMKTYVCIYTHRYGTSVPEYIVDNEGNPFRRLGPEEIIEYDDVPLKSDVPLFQDGWQKQKTGMAGEKAQRPSRWFNWIYYRPITDPLTAAMVKALAAKQPEDQAG